MELYHSTTQKQKILSEKKIRKNTSFRYLEYLKHLLDHVTESTSTESLSWNYPGSKRQAPFMGNGIYCFDNVQSALSYQTKSEVIKIQCSTDCEVLDLDKYQDIMNLFKSIEDAEKVLVDKIKDKDAVKGWQSLLLLLKECIMDEFINCQQAVGLIIYVLNYLVGYKIEEIITISYDKTAGPKYYIITNPAKIEKIC